MHADSHAGSGQAAVVETVQHYSIFSNKRGLKIKQAAAEILRYLSRDEFFADDSLTYVATESPDGVVMSGDDNGPFQDESTVVFTVLAYLQFCTLCNSSFACMCTRHLLHDCGLSVSSFSTHALCGGINGGNDLFRPYSACMTHAGRKPRRS